MTVSIHSLATAPPQGEGVFAVAPPSRSFAAGLRPSVDEVAVTVDRSELETVLASVNATLAESNPPQLQFRVDDELGQIVVSVIDPGDGTVLRQVPSEVALRIAQQLQAGAAAGVIDTIV